MLFFRAEKNEDGIKAYINPIREMVEGRWDLSRTFELPALKIAAEPIKIINTVFRKLHVVIEGILRNSIDLSSQAPALKEISGRFRKSNKEQERKVSDIAAAGMSMATSIDQIAQNTQLASEISSDIASDVNSAMETGESSHEHMVDIKSYVDELVSIIQGLEETSGSIGSIIDQIEEISEETGLLSLNAKIEAARSGVHGKGFAVIANEISTLSFQTKDATSDIKGKLSDIKNRINETVSSAVNVDKCVLEGQKLIRESNDSLSTVFRKHSEFHESLEEITEATTHQTREVRKISDDIILIEEGVRKQTLECENIFRIANEINESCDRMLMDVGVFKINQHNRACEIALKAAASDEIISMVRADQERFMKVLLNTHKFIEITYVTDKNGIQITDNIYRDDRFESQSSSVYGKDWSGREWFTEARDNNEPFVSNIYRSSATDDFCVTVSVPIKRDSGQFTGVLGVDINFEDLLNI